MGQNEMVENKFCFIMCSNDDFYLQEAMFYIKQLKIPQGYEIEIISISESSGMAAGYNEGMAASDAKYKIYMHQDVFILNQNFLKDILAIFKQDETIGMIGMVGAVKMPVNGVMWYSDRKGDIYSKGICSSQQIHSYHYHVEDGYSIVEAIDGLMMITSKDIPWREDLFDGYHYYDVSQSLEFLRQGYKIVVPHQKVPWIYHDSSIMNLRTYNHYRKIGMTEYKEIFSPEKFTVCNRKENDVPKSNILVVLIATDRYHEVQDTLQSLSFYHEIKKEQILIVDNGSTDELRHWLRYQQEYSFIRCNEILESYGKIMRKIVQEVVADEDLLILSPGIKLHRDAIAMLKQVMNGYNNCGAVTAGLDSSLYLPLSLNTMEEQVKNRNHKKIIQIPHYACLLSNQLIKKAEIESYHTPEVFFKDLSVQSILRNFYFYKLEESLFFCKNPVKIMEQSHYHKSFGNNDDECLFKKKWKLSYFSATPNYGLINMIDKREEEAVNVLEIGCDCGKNLLEVKNRYPNANVHGVEINPSSAVLSAKFAEVEVGDIEEKNLDFGEIKFDYILFGDVLEYLRDPQGTLSYCKELLKRDGRFIICVPNLNHYSVMKQLVNGYFTYTEMGLLDRTHIHFFTYYEIMHMIQIIGCKVENVVYHEGVSNVSQEDKEFVHKLMEISQKAKPFMYFAYQYILLVSKEGEKENEKGK